MTLQAMSLDPPDLALIHQGEKVHAPPPTKRHASPRVCVDFFSAGLPPFDEFVVKLPHVSIMVAFGMQSGWEAIGSKPLVKRSFRNRFHLIPADTELSIRSDAARPEFLIMHVDASFAASVMGELFERDEVGPPTIGNAQARLLALGKTIRGQMLGKSELKKLQLESFATLFLAESVDNVAPVQPGPICPQILSRLNDYIRAHLDQDLTLADLASVAGLSPSHFLKSFKEAVGETPHRYLTEHRVKHARDQLEQTNLSLAEIAYSSGFASQSHMTDVFRSKLSISPGRYRKSIRS